MDDDWIVTRTVPGGMIAVGMCGGIGGEVFVGWDEVHGSYPSVSGVGSFRGRIKRIRRQAKRLARSKTFRRIARTAMAVAKMTPYGAAAATAIDVAKKAKKLAEGEVDAMDLAEDTARRYMGMRGDLIVERGREDRGRTDRGGRAERALRMLVAGY